ncbi:MAG: anthranilate synthase component I family protein [Bacteroidetes bacterium]|nr:anthranilate synthase component I family protein [Bacteroidota bacterium]
MNDQIDLAIFRDKLIDYVSGFERFSVLDTGKGSVSGPSFYLLLAGWGKLDEFVFRNEKEDISRLDTFLTQHKGKWIFGHINYDVKNVFEPKLQGHREDKIGFPMLSFFVAEYVCGIRTNGEMFLHSQNESADALLKEDLLQKILQHPSVNKPSSHQLQPGSEIISESKYQQAVQQLLSHLHQGDIYEINYCLPFQLQGDLPSPEHLWKKMQEVQQSPFASLYRENDAWLLCCSPERFLSKEGHLILSQPIKGTAVRSPDPVADEQLKKQLFESAKERAENVMIVDLVRNDLGRIAERGTVQVDELFGIYSFAHVHQMISTITAQLKEGLPFTEVLRATFPMGSMTGAPKFRAMQIIEEQEIFRRGLYSGTVGYISPEGDFDFNVVIRSILYNSRHQQIYFPAGSAITALSNPVQEFAECLLKAEGMRKILEGGV